MSIVFLFLIFIILMKIQIRTYIPSDLEEIVAIINYNIIYSTALYDYNTRSIEQQRIIFEDKLNKNFPIIVAIVDNKIVGFGCLLIFRVRPFVPSIINTL